jgi:D-glycero-alpha-D-manno-heptose 1-phosphate guanylyltransferase
MDTYELLVLAGGFGTRLRAAVADVPKPLAPVGGRPFLGHQIDHWAAQGVTSMSFLLHHRADAIEAFVTHCAATLPASRLRTLTEPRPLGTGGAIAYAVQQLGLTGSFLVANADTWVGEGVASLRGAKAPAIGVVEVEDCERYGAVRLQPDGKIAEFAEKSACSGRGWINAGVYALHAQLFRDWNGGPFSMERELFPELARRGELTARPLETEFIDIGIPADYFRFCRWIERARAGAP